MFNPFKKQEILGQPKYHSELWRGANLLELMPKSVSVTRIDPLKHEGRTYMATFKGKKKFYGNSLMEVLDQLRDHYPVLNPIGKHIKLLPLEYL